MKNNNKIKSISFFWLLFLFISCNKENKIELTGKVVGKYEIEYHKDTIKVFSIQLSNHIETEKYININNEFYDVKNKKLFLSINRDTLYTEILDGFLYKTEIKKNNNNSFKTSTFLIDNHGKESLLTTFYYDKNYRIAKIEKTDLISFTPIK
ncbi:hypothetical protein C8J95_1204 [Elizabethkingia sp. YR214]|uniref:hypothetical protein n=1 Tax=Elizabethkingia sp. YR214 TaxID=2135667 RepID=UPI000D31E99B|nr:hypothetical protein [Elizabethkingia sp. YR214]PUB24726.1 hypothetical protein C8J95_1204 [Elizabethkingia sp. YR214]